MGACIHFLIAIGGIVKQRAKAARLTRRKVCDSVMVRSGVFAPLVGAAAFKAVGGFEQSSQWVRFPYTPVNFCTLFRTDSQKLA